MLKDHILQEIISYLTISHTKIEHDTIRIPIKATKYLHIKLTSYILEKIKHTKLGSLVITEDKIIISYSKEIPEQRPSNFIGGG